MGPVTSRPASSYLAGRPLGHRSGGQGQGAGSSDTGMGRGGSCPTSQEGVLHETCLGGECHMRSPLEDVLVHLRCLLMPAGKILPLTLGCISRLQPPAPCMGTWSYGRAGLEAEAQTPVQCSPWQSLAQGRAAQSTSPSWHPHVPKVRSVHPRLSLPTAAPCKAVAAGPRLKHSSFPALDGGGAEAFRAPWLLTLSQVKMRQNQHGVGDPKALGGGAEPCCCWCICPLPA